MTIHELADTYLQPYITKGNEIIPRYCPICHGGEHKDRNTFALNIDNKTYNCKRGKCGARGHFTQLCKHFGIEIYDTVPKKYKKPEIKPEKKADEEPGMPAVELSEDQNAEPETLEDDLIQGGEENEPEVL